MGVYKHRTHRQPLNLRLLPEPKGVGKGQSEKSGFAKIDENSFGPEHLVTASTPRKRSSRKQKMRMKGVRNRETVPLLLKCWIRNWFKILVWNATTHGVLILLQLNKISKNLKEVRGT